MKSLAFQIVASEIRDHQCIRVLQGQVHVGPETQTTYLRSCVCVGFYHSGLHLGALSHITGFGKDEGHDAQGALREIEKRLLCHGLCLKRCECFVIGGVDAARHVYDDVIGELNQQDLQFCELDVLGSFHRKLMLDPVEGKLDLFKKSTALW